MHRYHAVVSILALLLAGLPANAFADDAPTESKSIRLFKGNTEGMTEIIPGMVSLKHIYGKDVSVALFHVVPKEGEPIPIPPHTHGEEVAVVLKGKGIMRAGGQTIAFEPGDVMLIPAGLEHGGGDSGEVEGETLLLSIVTPPRTEMGPEGGTKSPYSSEGSGSASPR